MGYAFTYHRGLPMGRRGFFANDGGGMALPIADLPQAGLIAEWRFDEGSGTTISDHAGDHDISLVGQAMPEWTPRGITCRNQLLATPSVSNVRTLAILYRASRDELGKFVISGGNGTADGIQGEYCRPANTVHVGSGNGVSPLMRRSNGLGSYRLNRGGWVIVFVDYNAQRTTQFGLGGRIGASGFETAEAEVGWIGLYDRVLTDEDRDNIYSHVRGLYGRPRNIRVDWRDCKTLYDTVLLWGQSNAGGRAPLDDLSAAERARRPQNVEIAASRLLNVTWQQPAPFVVGTNQLSGIGSYAPSQVFGAETAAAYAWESLQPNRHLLISKTTGSGTELASVAGGAAASGGSWHPDELPTSGGYYRALKDWWTTEQAMLLLNKGPRLRQLWWIQGETDAEDQVQSLTYGANLSTLWNAAKAHTGYPNDLAMVIAQLSDAPALPHRNAVRTAQADLATNDPAVSLINTDSLPGDDLSDIHYGAEKQKALGEAFYHRLVATL